ncbi:MAG: TIGR04086 family membrane protein [Eubacteriales bacterium]
MRRADASGSGFKGYIISVLIGSLMALLICLLLLLPVSALILAGALDEGLSGIVLIVVVVVSSLIGGIISARRAGGRSLLVGLAEGVLLIIWFGVIGLLFFDRFIPKENGLGLLLASVAGGVIGGRISTPKGRARARKSRK